MTRAELRKPPKEVADLREQIEQWRRTRRGGEPMPAQLWSAAVTLTHEHTVCQVSRWLKVDYGTLKRRMTQAAPFDSPRTDSEPKSELPAKEQVEPEELDVSNSDLYDAEADALRFIELSGESLFGRGQDEQVIELFDTDGARMTIRQPAGVELDVVGLAAAFWRRGSCFR